MARELFLNAVHTGVDYYAIKSDKQDTVREYTERRTEESFWACDLPPLISE